MNLAVAGIMSVALAMGWFYRFMQDDAYISFRYARNLARGLGLVYNPGERIEGYTNFLWTVCLAPCYGFGVDIVIWSEILSVACFAGALWLTWRVARRWLGEKAALVALALVAGNYSFCAYATGGLETMFGIFWILLTVDALACDRFLLASLATVASFMTRMDSSLLLFPFWLTAAFPSGLRMARVRPIAVGSAVVLPSVALWLVCRHAYYGAWLPNTFLIKGDVSPVRGLMYVGLFWVLYGYVVLAGLSFVKGAFRRLPRTALAAVVLWHGYLILVGGDFMEFRLFLPCFPFLAILTASLATVAWRCVPVALVLLGLAGIPRFIPAQLIQTIPDLQDYRDEMRDFSQELMRILGPNVRDVRVAITCAGVLPYLTDLPTLDLLGLNDRDVALEGDPVKPAYAWLGNRPGHCRMATWPMVVEKRVNLLINFAWTADRVPEWRTVADLNAAWPRFHVEIPSGTEARVVWWPIAGGRHWPMVYVADHPAVDEAIRRSNARVQVLR